MIFLKHASLNCLYKINTLVNTLVNIIIRYISNISIRGINYSLLICFFILSFPFPSYSTEKETQSPSFEQHLNARIETLIQQKLPHAQVGILLQDAKTGQLLYSRRVHENFLPASTTKLLSTTAALLKLGPDFRFETNVKINPNQLKQGKLQGDLIIQFKGDPSFTTENLLNLIKNIKNAGIKEINGDILIDNTYYSGLLHSLGTSWDSLPWAYAAPATAIILNENKVNLVLTPSKTIGEKASLTLAPEETSNKINISNDIISVTESEAKELCQVSIETNSQNEITAYGCWPSKETSDPISVAIQNPALLARQWILEGIKKENIKLKGQITLGGSAAELKTIASHTSKPLFDLIKIVLQDSNNIYADSITKTLGHHQFEKGSFATGVLSIKEILSKNLGIDTSTIKLQDGSGLSRYNAFSPYHLAKLLRGMYHHTYFNQYYKPAFPTSGETGLLSHRMKTFDLNGHVQAKTGTMTGTSSLAGYMTSNNKQDRIFVIMINQATIDPKELKNIENNLCEILAAY